MSASRIGVLLTLLLMACASARARDVEPAESESASGSSAQEPTHTDAAPSPQAPDPTVDALRALLDQARAAQVAGDHAGAREQITAAIERALRDLAGRQDARACAALDELSNFAYEAGESRSAESGWRLAVEIFSSTRPDDDPVLQRARYNLGMALRSLGDLRAARVLQEKVLEVSSRTLPDDHPDLQRARQGLALTIREQGDPARARPLEEKVLDVYSRTLPDDHTDLQRARGNLASTLYMQGDIPGARALLEKVLEVFSRTLPDEHHDLQRTRGNLAVMLKESGDLPRARVLQEKVLQVYSRTLPDDHPGLQGARANLALTIKDLGDLSDARALEEKVLETRARTLPDDHADLQRARANLAMTLYSLGDLQAARTLLEVALKNLSRTFPDDHPDLQGTRLNLAVTIHEMGDLAGARALFEKVLDVDSHTLPDEHPSLQLARGNLALTLRDLGDLQGARSLQEKVLEVYSRTFPDEHPDVQRARMNLAGTLYLLHDLASAKAQQEQALEVYSRTLPDEHLDVQATRLNLSATLVALGNLAGARALQEKVLEIRSRTLPDGHPHLQLARMNLARTILDSSSQKGDEAERESERKAASSILGSFSLALARVARETCLTAPGREAEERCARMTEDLDFLLSATLGYGELAPLSELREEVFLASESTRSAAIASATVARAAASSLAYHAERERFRAATEELAQLAQGGTTSAEFQQALRERESAESGLLALSRELAGGRSSGLGIDASTLSSALTSDEVAVAYRRFVRFDVKHSPAAGSSEAVVPVRSEVPSLCAFVVRGSKGRPDEGSAPLPAVTLVDLGPIAPIQEATRAWRDAIGLGAERGLAVGNGEVDRVRMRGDDLRRHILDPLVQALGSAKRVIVVLDDVLHLVPIDALPLADSSQLVGDRWRVETRASLPELLAPTATPRGLMLVAFGGVSFNSAPLDLTAEETTPDDVESPANTLPVDPAAELLRRATWEPGFPPLTHAGEEVRGIGALYAEVFEGERPARVVERRKASREALETLAPKTRWLHVATHGWFASESIRSWSDPGPIDVKSGLGLRLSGEEQVRGMSPMLLCGLALAGANLPADALGRSQGLITAEELSTLDLSECELAVLSACDTARGEMRRAGQGVASLQKALQIAGARSVITSLWKVPDEATKELMLDFYRRLWVEKKPKWQALWEAKGRLRNAKDERGQPRYRTRDWAAWALTGEQD